MKTRYHQKSTWDDNPENGARIQLMEGYQVPFVQRYCIDEYAHYKYTKPEDQSPFETQFFRYPVRKPSPFVKSQPLAVEINKTIELNKGQPQDQKYTAKIQCMDIQLYMKHLYLPDSNGASQDDPNQHKE